MTGRELTDGAEDWGEGDPLAVIGRLVEVGGLDLVDVGCGDGRLARQLVERGATVVGVEPDPVQAARHRAAPPVPGLAFVEAPGEALPLADASADGVVFCYSLHHVPADSMDTALAEAMRVLRPERGFLCVLEPLLTGSMEAVWQTFHDETEERTRAYEALHRTAGPRFAEARELRYREPVRYPDFAAFLDEVDGITWGDRSIGPEAEAATRAAFEAGRSGPRYLFHQHVRVNFYRTPS